MRIKEVFEGNFLLGHHVVQVMEGDAWKMKI